MLNNFRTWWSKSKKKREQFSARDTPIQSGKQPHLIGETMLASSESHKPFWMEISSWDDVHCKRKCRILQNLTVVKEWSEYKISNNTYLCTCAANGLSWGTHPMMIHCHQHLQQTWLNQEAATAHIGDEKWGLGKQTQAAQTSNLTLVTRHQPDTSSSSYV